MASHAYTVDTGTTIVDKNNLAAFRETLAARLKP